MEKPRVWLITGASSGLGRSLTEFILSRGDVVVATLRKPEVLDGLVANYPPDKLLVIKVDVTNPTDIDRAFSHTREVFGRLDVVFNNAGYSIYGEAEMTPTKEARALFEVNFWGAILVSRAAVKFFREVNELGRHQQSVAEQGPRGYNIEGCPDLRCSLSTESALKDVDGGGVLLQNSSVTGFEGIPGFSFYAASKHALEGFSTSLVRELLPQWNIKVCILQTGSFATNGIANTTFFPENPAYNDQESLLTTLRGMITAPGFKFGGDPNKFAKAVYSLIEGGDIPLHLPLGQDALMCAKERAELREKEISGATPWSADLMRAA